LHPNVDPVPNLFLPRTIVSKADRLVGAGGIIETSTQNLTLYNSAVRLRLLGGANPHDELLGPNGRVLSSDLSWGVEGFINGQWVPLNPSSSNFIIIGTNSTGTYVARTMHVAGEYSGKLMVVYKATTAGPVQWDLQFTSGTIARYRFKLSWQNATSPDRLFGVQRRLQASFGSSNYTLSWEDVPATFSAITSISPGQFALFIDPGTQTSRLEVDPSIVGSSSTLDATAYGFQRKIFYDPTGGRYWVFYYDGAQVKYTNSSDGVNWFSPQSMPAGWPTLCDVQTCAPAVSYSGQTLIVATGNSVGGTLIRGQVAWASISYVIGTISGAKISWRPVYQAGTRSFTCFFNYCSVSLGHRFVSVTLSNGFLAFSSNWYITVLGTSFCAGGAYSENAELVAFRGGELVADRQYGCGLADQYFKSIVIPADSQGGVRLIYQFSPSGTSAQLKTRLFYGTPVSQTAVASADSYTNSSSPDTNYGGQSRLMLWNVSGRVEDTFISFNLPAAIASEQFSSASLTMKIGAAWGPVGPFLHGLAIYANNSTWSESSITYHHMPGPLPGTLSWVPNFIDSCIFTNPCPDVIATYDVSSSIAGMYKPQDDINHWSNYGLFLFVVDRGGTIANYYSRETSSPPTLNATFSCCMAPYQIIDPTAYYQPGFSDFSDFSAVSDTSYGIHVVYPGIGENVTYAYLNPVSSQWSYSTAIIPATPSPAITLDYSTNDLYVFGILGSSIVMKSKTPAEQWRDRSAVFPVTGQGSIDELGSNLVSASSNGANRTLLMWTQRNGTSYTGNVMFASIPIERVWSPYATPSDPWDGNGVSPYGQYFSNLGESVSPSSGMLTVRQTDLSLRGRGLSLEITRVFTEPISVPGGTTLNYETYPWAPIGNGWQLNFPWMSSGQYPSFIHLWDGQGYRIPMSFWTGSALTTTFENHQGEQFQLIRSVPDVYMYDRAGNLYAFVGNDHRLTRIFDPLGNNITVSYNSSTNVISQITDTVGRTFLLCYTSGLLTSIEQGSSICGSGFARRITYGYSSQSLTRVTDPATRTTSYSYDTTGWLLTRITYPTGWYTSYTYSQNLLGNGAYTYRVFRQITNASALIPIRRFEYNYTQGPGDQITNSIVKTYNGTSSQPLSYNTYALSFAAMNWNISDSSHNFVRGGQQRFGVNGEVTSEVNLVTDGSNLGSLTNYYRYDLWGDLIYSRRVINASAGWYHETFNSYYNNGLQPGFNAFQETFSQNNFTSTDSSWNVYNGTWRVKNGVYNGTSPVFSPANQAVFSWTGFSSSNVSIIASILITKPMASTDQRVGLIAHYPGIGVREWALVLHNTAGGVKLSLLDENVRWGPENPCTLSYNVWYRFNFTISGTQAWGSASAPGITPCIVSGSFTSNDITSATGIGLYAGGYSALFDNVRVATVARGITGTSFSNSFIQNGAPASNIHGALAGRAELQNGTRSVPIETYFGYAWRGGLNQTRQLYNSASGAQWLTSSIKYDRFGNPTSATDARGNVTSYGYSPKYQSAYLTSLNQTLVPGGTLISKLFSYNFTIGTMLSSVDPNGYNTTYRYDILSRLTRVSYPTGDFTAYTYNDQANYVNATNEQGWKTQQIYDGLGRLSAVEKFLNGQPYSSENYTYDWQGKVTSETDALWNRFSYQYDTLGRPTITTQPDGNSTSKQYNDILNVISSYDENGNGLGNSQYDRLSHLTQVFQFGGCSGCFYYANYFQDEVGNLRKATVPFGNNYLTRPSTIYAYDNLNRPTSISYADGKSESYTYDANGNVASKLDRSGVRTVYSYDSMNRISTITYRGSVITSDNYTYDKTGNLLQLQSQNATINYTYDSRNRVLTESYKINGATCVGGPIGDCGGGGSVAAGTLITLADGSVAPVQQLQAGMNLLSYNITTGQYVVSTITRVETVQTNNMLVIKTDSGVPLRTDNATIQQLWVRQSNGTVGWLSVTKLRVGDYLYKALEKQWTRVTEIDYIPGSFTLYDLYTTAPSDYIASSYLDPVKSPTGGPSSQSPSTSTPGGIVPFGYSIRFRYSGETLAQITYNDLLQVNYAYDGLGRVSVATWTIGLAFTNYYANFTYYKNDQVKTVQFGNGHPGNGPLESYMYDSLSRTKSIAVLKPGENTPSLLSLTYQYTNTGDVYNVTGLVNSGRVSEQYSYDPMNRLTGGALVNGPLTSPVSTTMSYSYDGMDNRVSQSLHGQATSYNYNSGNNTLASSTTGSSTTSYGYDGNGNLVSKNSGSSQWSYTWDVPGHLLKAGNNSGVQGYYAYDGLGRRVESMEGSGRAFYDYLGTDTLSEHCCAGSDNDYVYAAGMRIAKVVCAACNYPSVFYYFADALGTTRLVTDSSTSVNVIFSESYQPYGTDNKGTGSETYKFTGKLYSAATGLYYYGARWYDATTGRFISQDPYPGRLGNPQTLNPYTYVLDNPTNSVDPSGEVSEECAWTNCCDIGNFGGCLSTAAVSGAQWYGGLSPEEKQAVGIGALALLTFATGGTDLLFVGAAGFGIAAGAYTGYTYATGGTPTMSGALEWGSIGFGLALLAYGGYSIGAKLLAESSSGASDAELLNIRTIGRGINLPETAEKGGIPNSIMRTFDDRGLHTMGFYDENGNMIVRVDVTGPPHAGVPTPHVLDYYPEPKPGGGYGFGKQFWGPTDRGFDELIAWIAPIED